MIGLSIATATVVGQNIGAGDWDRARAASRMAAWLGFLGLTAVGLILLPFARPIMTALAPGEPAVIASATTFAHIYLPLVGVLAVPQILLGTFRGAGSTRQSMTISMLMQWLFQLPAALVCGGAGSAAPGEHARRADRGRRVQPVDDGHGQASMRTANNDVSMLTRAHEQR